MPIRIYGAGMAGLLSSAMLRRLQPRVYEAQGVLPDNHGALLRFRSDAVQKATGIRFRQVNVLKAVKSNGQLHTTATMRDANQYSYKVTGEIQPRSVLNLEPCDRWIAPPDFIGNMARDAILRMNEPLTLEGLTRNHEEGVVTISTIPMPALMKLVGWPDPGFHWHTVWSVTAEIQSPHVDVYQTIYYPGTEHYYRASITGNKIIVEYMGVPPHPDDDLAEVMLDFGLPIGTHCHQSSPFRRQEYGKLVPLPNEARQTFILAMTDKYNCYSVGRFATWRQILLDDVVKDVRWVEGSINQRNAYARTLKALEPL